MFRLGGSRVETSTANRCGLRLSLSELTPFAALSLPNDPLGYVLDAKAYELFAQGWIVNPHVLRRESEVLILRNLWVGISLQQ